MRLVPMPKLARVDGAVAITLNDEDSLACAARPYADRTMTPTNAMTVVRIEPSYHPVPHRVSTGVALNSHSGMAIPSAARVQCDRVGVVITYVICALVWGTTWFAIRVSIAPEGYPAFLSAAIRFTI